MNTMHIARLLIQRNHRHTRRTFVGVVAAGTGVAAAAAAAAASSAIHVASAEGEGKEGVTEDLTTAGLTSSTVATPGLAIGTNWLVMKGAAWGIPNMIYIGALL